MRNEEKSCFCGTGEATNCARNSVWCCMVLLSRRQSGFVQEKMAVGVASLWPSLWPSVVCGVFGCIARRDGPQLTAECRDRDLGWSVNEADLVLDEAK